MAMMMSDDGLNFIARREELRLKAYKPTSNDVWTIGYGHTGADVYQGQTCTPDEAMAWLKSDSASAVNSVNNMVSVTLKQCEFDALVDLVFNVGAGAFAKSRALRYLNEGYKQNFCIQAFSRDDGFTKQAGQILEGLVNRRNKEKILFTKGIYI